jgi:LysM repeat protein
MKHFKKPALIAILVVALFALTMPMALASGGVHHYVQPGETLYSIGRLYGANPNCIAQTNGLYNPNYIYAGQVLFVPDNCCGNPQPGPGVTVHIVHPGETLFSIGRWYGVNPYHIAHANGLYNPNYIFAGQRLLIPVSPW